MSSKRRLTQALGLVFAASVCSLASCSGGDYAILVRVTGSPSDTASLYATAKLGDTYAMKGLDIAPPLPLDMIGIRLPADKTGTLTVEVSALGTDQCKSASGTVTVNLDSGRGQEVTVNLAALSPRRCSLIINQRGEGNVTVTPAGTPCGTGCYDYDQNAGVTLNFSAQGKSYGAQTYLSAGGVCDGTSDCSVKLATRVNAEVKFQPRLCSLSKWCWYHPLPQGNILKGIYGTSAADIWAVGDGGTAMHYDGQTWSLVPTGTSRFLRGVWAGSASSAWIVGDAGTVLKWDGSKLLPETSGSAVNLNSVWGSSAANLYAAGDNGVIIRSTGSGAWRPDSSGTTVNLSKVTGSGEQNVWALGANSTILSSSGVSWTKQSVSASLFTVNDIWSPGTGDLWVASGTTASNCNVARLNGGQWQVPIATKFCLSPIRAISGSGPKDVWAAGSETTIGHYTAGDPTNEFDVDLVAMGSVKGLTPTFNAAWSVGPGDVYLATSDGNIFRRVGEKGGTQVTAPLPWVYAKVGTGVQNLVVATGTTTTEYFLYSDGTSYSSDGRKISQIPSIPVTTVYDAWTAPDNGMVVAAGSSGSVYRYTGGASWVSNKPSGLVSEVISVGGTSSTDYYIGTSGGNIYRFSGGTWSANAINGTPYAGYVQSIFGRSASEVWAAADAGVTVRINNGVPTKITNPAPGTISLYAIHGPPNSKHVWAVGSGGFVMRSMDGTIASPSFTTMSSGVNADLSSVVALSESDVWIAGDAGVLLHWDGTKLQQVSGPFGGRNLIKLHSPSQTDIWLVGAGNAIWRYIP